MPSVIFNAYAQGYFSMSSMRKYVSAHIVRTKRLFSDRRETPINNFILSRYRMLYRLEIHL